MIILFKTIKIAYIGFIILICLLSPAIGLAALIGSLFIWNLIKAILGGIFTVMSKLNKVENTLLHVQ